MAVIDAKIRDNHCHIDGVDYFRARADAVLLGDAGEKKVPSTQDPHLAVQASVPRRQLKLHRATRIDLQGAGVDARDLKFGMTVPGAGRLDVGAAARQIEDKTLSLVRLEVLPNDIVEAAMGSPEVMAVLLRAGDAGRLVHQVVVPMPTTTAIGFERATSFKVDGSAGSMRIGVGGKSDLAVDLVPGSTVAYLLLEPEWDARLPHDGTRVIGWKADPWSLR